MRRNIALVVTYNRKEYLEKCLKAILEQEKELIKVVVIDNNSTDGTDCLMADQFNTDIFDYIKLDKNTGGAGGFYEGVKYIQKTYEYDWLWLMDDDTIPNSSTLNGFMKSLDFLEYEAQDKKISFLASTVYGPNDEPMNVPTVSPTVNKNGYADWYVYVPQNLVKIETATFVSLLISSKAISKIGLPKKDYFIWGDDTEYTMRLTRNYGSAYLSGKSIVLHDRKGAKALSLKDETNENRIKMYYYAYRNNIITKKIYYGNGSAFKLSILFLIDSLRILKSNNTKFKMKKFKIIWKGVIGGIFNKSLTK